MALAIAGRDQVEGAECRGITHWFGRERQLN